MERRKYIKGGLVGGSKFIGTFEVPEGCYTENQDLCIRMQDME